MADASGSAAGSPAEKKQGKVKKHNKKEVTQAAMADIPEPEYWAHRLKVWEECKKRRADEYKRQEAPIKVTLVKNGQVVDAVAFKSTPIMVAKGLPEDVVNPKEIVVARVDGKVMWDLLRPLEADCTLEWFTFDDDLGQETFWHSSSHVLGESLEQLFGAHLCKGPPVEDGFYYDVAMDRPVSEDDFGKIEKLAQKVVKEKQTFERIVLKKEEALEMFKHNHFKVDIISRKIEDGTTCTAYRCGPLIDLCRGPHIPDTGRIKAFEVTKNSSAYWENDANNESLQRVYGISFPSKERLKEWRHFREEAAKRDHRRIGQQQELFFFHNLSPGSCFFLPHGTRIYNTLTNFIKKEYARRGFQEVVTPNVYNVDLWKTSGHWQNYKDNMFSFEVEKQTFAMKPMNCPGHCLMFDHRMRSYRELPIRLADFGVLHRNELSGALTGLTRVRRFQQDDAHIFCAADQVESEIQGCLDFLQHVYGIFGFEFELDLSTRPTEKYMGEIEQWDQAEAALAKALDKFGRPWKINPGDGAFYGPKIDIKIYDALRRRHQCATIQLDFQLPIKFNLQFATASGDADAQARYSRPVIIHRAILGSVERMMAVLCEHTGGKWPFWLSPRQCIVVPVHTGINEYAEKVISAVQDAGFFCEADLSDRKLAKKVREAQLAQYNFLLVVGAEEKEAETVNMRTRDNQVHGMFSIPDLLKELARLRDEYQ